LHDISYLASVWRDFHDAQRIDQVTESASPNAIFHGNEMLVSSAANRKQKAKGKL
jgi:hypothetical protein